MADRVLVMHEGRLTGELSPRAGRRGARDARGDRTADGGGGMSTEAVAQAERAAGGAAARRYAEWIFRVRELGIVAALALLILVTAVARAALRGGRLAAQPRAQRGDLRDPRRGRDARHHHPQRRPLGRLGARAERLPGGRPAVLEHGPADRRRGRARRRARRGLRRAQRRARDLGPRARARRHARHAVRLPRPGVPVDGRPPGQRRDAARPVPEPRHRLDRSGSRRWRSSRSSSCSSSASGCATSAPGASCTRSARTPRAPASPACARIAACWPRSCSAARSRASAACSSPRASARSTRRRARATS